MSAQPADSLVAFCARHGIRAPLLQEPVGAGRNSRVTRLRNADGQWILKEYRPPGHGATGGHDRLGAEFAFLQYLEDGNIPRVPRPLGFDRAPCRALYSSLPGVRPTHVTADHVSQAAQFIAAVNRDRATVRGRALGGAADACITGDDHLALVRRRLKTLTALKPRSIPEEQAVALVSEYLAPRWQELEGRLSGAVAAAPASARILSPSDFGFHNALAQDGRLSFVDFEYAGWDDPAKLVCDFICQPEVPVTAAQGRQFAEALAGALPNVGDLPRRVEWLLPAHRLKWCCILLNEFRPKYHRRRVHAGIVPAGLLTSQLGKARRYFNEHMDELPGMSDPAPRAR